MITIFRNLDLGEAAAFSYEIRYLINEKKIILSAEVGKQPTAELSGKPVSLKELRDKWTPRYVVGYYSGVSDRFEELFAKHDLKARDLTLTPAASGTAPQKLQLRRFICARA